MFHNVTVLFMLTSLYVWDVMLFCCMIVTITYQQSTARITHAHTTSILSYNVFFVGEDDFIEVAEYLIGLQAHELTLLGSCLGLRITRLRSMENQKTYREDMILAWLMKEDSVKSPTWENLIKALKKPLIGHMHGNCYNYS